jgi:hydroxyethylthiazole kinase-like uncharacterized protein yjeF
MKLVSVAEMQAVEREANANGLTYEIMMENAGRNLAEVILEEYGFLEEEGVMGLVGSGNNGGDTLVALAHLVQEGWKASAYIVRPRAENDPLVNRLAQAGGVVVKIEQDPNLETLASWFSDHGILMDGVLGTGTRLPLKSELAQVLGFVRARLVEMDDAPCVVAVDCPSGIDCDSGEAAPECIPAELTVTMAAIKQGLFKFPAFDLAGDIRLVGIGLPEGEQSLKSWQDLRCEVIDEDWVRPVLPARPSDAHKGTFGTALVVAGSVNYTGAALLAGQAAYRAGAGLVTLAIPASLHSALAGQFPEATWLILPEDVGVIAEDGAEIVIENLSRATAMLIGPGFGMEDTTAAFLSLLFTSSHKPGVGKIGFIHTPSDSSAKVKNNMPPLVIDADGLKLLARIPDWYTHLPAPAILTPHPGEMAVLTGLSKDEILADRLSVARKYSQSWGHVVVLKSAFTIIAAPDGQTAVIPVASPALARAGTGDVLAGVIVGLRAQGVDSFPAAVAGAWIHAQAGLLAAQKLGNTASVLAGDVLHSVIDILTELQ